MTTKRYGREEGEELDEKESRRGEELKSNERSKDKDEALPHLSLETALLPPPFTDAPYNHPYMYTLSIGYDTSGDTKFCVARLSSTHRRTRARYSTNTSALIYATLCAICRHECIRTYLISRVYICTDLELE